MRRQLDMFNLEPVLPYVRGSDTSRAAAESFDEAAMNAMQRRVLNLIELAGQRGMTCDDVEIAAELRHQTCSARVRELAKRGLIEDSGERRKTRSGRLAVIWTKR